MRHGITMIQILPGAVALALLVPSLGAQEARLVTEREAVALLAEGTLPDRLRALRVASALGPGASSELKLAVIAATWAELRGETDTPPDSEAIFDYLETVAKLRDLRAVPLLVEVLVNGPGAANALADLAPESIPAVFAAVSNPEEDPFRVGMGLTALRFMVEDGALTVGQAERVRGAVQERLSGSQSSFVVRAALRLALMLEDSELRTVVERIANDRAAAEELLSPLLPSGNPRGEDDRARDIDITQEYARTVLSGGGADIGPFRRPWDARR